MFDNRKIKHLRRLPDGNNIVLLWIMLLTMAGRCNAGGMIFLTENIPYTTKMLADELGFEENTVILGIEVLEQLNMIITENGCFTIAGWEEYQNIDGLNTIREQTRQRVAKHREQKRLAVQSETCNATGNVTVTLRNATEEDKEEEKEKEEEFHSINLSGETAQNFTKDRYDEYRMKYLGGELGHGVVFMSDAQFGDLCDKLSLEELDKYLAIVANCELDGKSFTKKTHYQAILDMVAKDRAIHK